MTLKNELFQKNITEQQAAFVAQGFLELLSGQLFDAAQQAEHAVDLFEARRPDKVLAALQMIERELADASFSHKTASLLIDKGDKSKQIKLS